jgi:hypothetical protein
MSERLRPNGSFPAEDDSKLRQPADDLVDDVDTEQLDDESHELPVTYPGLDPDDE